MTEKHIAEKHIVCVTFKAKPEHSITFEDVMQSVKTDLPTVEGCNSVRIMRHKDDPLTYTLIEDWTEQKLHEVHINGLVTSGLWDNIEAMLSEAPTSFVFIDI